MLAEGRLEPHMGILNIGHIRNAIQPRFEPLLDLSDVPPQCPPQDRESQILTRSLAAFAIAELAGVDDGIAAKAVVDGSDDNGIDAFYFDRDEQICYLVQSKWDRDGKGSVTLGEMLKFIQGIRDLLQNDMTRFGKLQAKSADVYSAITDPRLQFVVVLAYTGEYELAENVRRPMDQLLESENSVDELISFRPLRQADLHRIVAQKTAGKPINLKVMLKEWGLITEPYRAYYGQVALEEVAGWKEHGTALYKLNLRGYRGSTEVNEAIIQTAKHAPGHFWYFNNGITVICDSIDKLPQGGSNRDIGIFQCNGASVVNGAQTVGSIITAHDSGSNGSSNAWVLVRLISLEKCPDNFGTDLTKAANTQNRIEKKDFAAQDPQQERLKTELQLECQKIYSYKTGDRTPSPDEGCTFDDAVVALACAQADMGLSTQAKREVGKLYDDISKAPYTSIFNAGLSALRLWRAVATMRVVEDELKAQQGGLQKRDKLIAVHGNRFVLHHVFKALGNLDGQVADFENSLTKAREATREILARTIEAANTEAFKDYYAANIFKNAVRCKDLASSLKKPDDTATPGDQLKLLDPA